MKGRRFFIQEMSVFSRREDKERVNKTVTKINEKCATQGSGISAILLPFYFHALVILFPTLVILFPTLVILFPKVGILITKGGRKIGTDIGSQINLCLKISAHKDLRSSATSARPHAKTQRARSDMFFCSYVKIFHTDIADGRRILCPFVLMSKKLHTEAQKYTEFCFACSAKVCAVCVRQFHSARH